MGRRVIRFSLSESEIDRAIRELNAYKQDLIRKAELLRQRVAEMISNEAQKGFNGAIVSDLIGDEARYPHVDVAVETSGKITLVIARNKEADSNDAMWVEFGAGVYHNGSAGSSPHPKGAELGFTIGGYGYG